MNRRQFQTALLAGLRARTGGIAALQWEAASIRNKFSWIPRNPVLLAMAVLFGLSGLAAFPINLAITVCFGLAWTASFANDLQANLHSEAVRPYLLSLPVADRKIWLMQFRVAVLRQRLWFLALFLQLAVILLRLPGKTSLYAWLFSLLAAAGVMILTGLLSLALVVFTRLNWASISGAIFFLLPIGIGLLLENHAGLLAAIGQFLAPFSAAGWVADYLTADISGQLLPWHRLALVPAGIGLGLYAWNIGRANYKVLPIERPRFSDLWQSMLSEIPPEATQVLMDSLYGKPAWANRPGMIERICRRWLNPRENQLAGLVFRDPIDWTKQWKIGLGLVVLAGLVVYAAPSTRLSSWTLIVAGGTAIVVTLPVLFLGWGGFSVTHPTLCPIPTHWFFLVPLQLYLRTTWKLFCLRALCAAPHFALLTLLSAKQLQLPTGFVALVALRILALLLLAYPLVPAFQITPSSHAPGASAWRAVAFVGCLMFLVLVLLVSGFATFMPLSGGFQTTSMWVFGAASFAVWKLYHRAYDRGMFDLIAKPDRML